MTVYRFFNINDNRNFRGRSMTLNVTTTIESMNKILWRHCLINNHTHACTRAHTRAHKHWQMLWNKCCDLKPNGVCCYRKVINDLLNYFTLLCG